MSDRLDIITEDDCCNPLLSIALAEGLTRDHWTCPDCGCEWRARDVGAVRHWEPVPLIAIW